ncbi:MAG: GYDIA family GHMP kinase [Apibacter sp.]|uniref:GYDIA family GHMP kinase n=1 Tax=Apibacter sp. TaxID=2023709 RepID=UPI0025E897DB|nr:GYDIA family GHMP kinase [Apibacter sp.]MCT6868379.1 GYDIA family GHMP kinase [Apibacter sp.]
MSIFQKFKSNGKLLLTGEYTVLDGALSLAIPTRLGQSLLVKEADKLHHKIVWKAHKNDGKLWFKTILDIRSNKIEETDNINFSKRLLHIFQEANKLGSKKFKNNFGYECTTQLDFPENWGFGTSSTLINNIAHWAKVDPYKLLENTFGGSGYDIACANAITPITYQLKENSSSRVEKVMLSKEITDHLLFVYLNQKQDSREGIQQYKQRTKSEFLLDAISKITREISNPKITFTHFSNLILEHEQMISQFINIQPVKERLFSDYPGFIKSLGAWGGDFIMVEKLEISDDYFKKKGYNVIKRYNEIIY